MAFDRNDIRRGFDKHAGEYEQHADLQRQVLQRVAAYLQPKLHTGDTVLDVGCGTGRLRAMLPEAGVLAGCDVAFNMCQQAAKRMERVVCADAMALPYADASVDAVVCSLMLQWMDDRAATLAEMNRVLKPGGVAMITTFGPHTLHELRAAFSVVDDTPHVSHFATLGELVGDSQKAGFDCADIKDDYIDLSYASCRELMLSVKSIGAANHLAERRKSLTGKGRLAAMETYYNAHYPAMDGGVRATWEVVYLMLHKPVGGV